MRLRVLPSTAASRIRTVSLRGAEAPRPQGPPSPAWERRAASSRTKHRNGTKHRPSLVTQGGRRAAAWNDLPHRRGAPRRVGAVVAACGRRGGRVLYAASGVRLASSPRRRRDRGAALFLEFACAASPTVSSSSRGRLRHRPRHRRALRGRGGLRRAGGPHARQARVRRRHAGSGAHPRPTLRRGAAGGRARPRRRRGRALRRRRRDGQQRRRGAGGRRARARARRLAPGDRHRPGRRLPRLPLRAARTAQAARLHRQRRPRYPGSAPTGAWPPTTPPRAARST